MKQFNFSVTMASKILKMGSRVIFWVGEPPQNFFSKLEGVGEIMPFYFDFDHNSNNLKQSIFLFILAILLTMIFMFMEKCCGCCCIGVTCCNISDKTRVYDPDLEDVQYQDSLEME